MSTPRRGNRPTPAQLLALKRVREKCVGQIPVCQTGAWSGVRLGMMRQLESRNWVELTEFVLGGGIPVRIKGWRLTSLGMAALKEATDEAE